MFKKFIFYFCICSSTLSYAMMEEEKPNEHTALLAMMPAEDKKIYDNLLVAIKESSAKKTQDLLALLEEKNMLSGKYKPLFDQLLTLATNEHLVRDQIQATPFNKNIKNILMGTTVGLFGLGILGTNLTLHFMHNEPSATLVSTDSIAAIGLTALGFSNVYAGIKKRDPKLKLSEAFFILSLLQSKNPTPTV